MVKLAAYGLCGLVFGAGLAISGMVNPAKVLNFLDVGGDWDPSLAFVMGSALLVTSIGSRLAGRLPNPILEREFTLPARAEIDRELVSGALLFGGGWGLVGLCPGPALANLGRVDASLYGFVAAMIAGMLLFRWFGAAPWRGSTLVLGVVLSGASLVGGIAHAEEGGAAAGLRPWISLRFPGIEWVETERLAAWMNADAEPALVLLDARTQAEFDVSHLAGARRVDPDAEKLDLGKLPPETPIVVYCSVGYRSGAVARRLGAARFTRVYNLVGGIFQWANEGRPVYRGRERATNVHPYDRTWGRMLDANLHPEK